MTRLQTRHSSKNPTRGTNPPGGQVLVEFAIISFVFLFLVAAILAFGLLLFSANTLQQAADVGAQELARHPAAPNADFYTALEASGLYAEADLVVPLGTDVSTLPVINRLLFPLYIFDPDIDQLRYPGALVNNNNGDQTVLIPILNTVDAASGSQQIVEWRRVLEEVTDSDGDGPYPLDSPVEDIDPGMVALRINYPYQAASLVSYEYRSGDASGPQIDLVDVLGEDNVVNVPVRADDTAVSDPTTFLADNGYTLANVAADPDFGAYPHRGQYGLGTQVAYNTFVRPYRKVVTAQAIYRREIFTAP